MRHRSKAEKEMVFARLVEAAKKDPQVERRALAQRFGVNVSTVLVALKLAGTYQPRPRGGRRA